MPLVLWIGAHALQLYLAARVVFETPESGHARSQAALFASLAALTLSLITWVRFIVVFVVGRSSNVAQLAGDSGYALWNLWVGAWPFLLFSLPVAFVAAIAAALMPPYPPRQRGSFAGRICAAIGCACALDVVITHFADA